MPIMGILVRSIDELKSLLEQSAQFGTAVRGRPQGGHRESIEIQSYEHDVQ